MHWFDLLLFSSSIFVIIKWKIVNIQLVILGKYLFKLSKIWFYQLILENSALPIFKSILCFANLKSLISIMLNIYLKNELLWIIFYVFYYRLIKTIESLSKAKNLKVLRLLFCNFNKINNKICFQINSINSKNNLIAQNKWFILINIHFFVE